MCSIIIVPRPTSHDSVSDRLCPSTTWAIRWASKVQPSKSAKFRLGPRVAQYRQRGILPLLEATSGQATILGNSTSPLASAQEAAEAMNPTLSQAGEYKYKKKGSKMKKY